MDAVFCTSVVSLDFYFSFTGKNLMLLPELKLPLGFNSSHGDGF